MRVFLALKYYSCDLICGVYVSVDKQDPKKNEIHELFRGWSGVPYLMSSFIDKETEIATPTYYRDVHQDAFNTMLEDLKMIVHPILGEHGVVYEDKDYWYYDLQLSPDSINSRDNNASPLVAIVNLRKLINALEEACEKNLEIKTSIGSLVDVFLEARNILIKSYLIYISPHVHIDSYDEIYLQELAWDNYRGKMQLFAKNIAQIAINNANFYEVVIADLNLTSKEMTKLCVALLQNTHITSIKITNCLLDYNLIGQLCDAIQKSRIPLINLQINDCVTTADGRKILERTMKVIERNINELLKLAEADDSTAQYKIGLMFLEGQGLVKDQTKALVWLERSVAHGNPLAKCELANLLWVGGNEIRQNRVRAKVLYEEAAVADITMAQFKLGEIFYQGNGLQQDYARALELFKAAAKKKHAWSFCNIGDIYRDAKGVACDYVEAERNYIIAAEAGIAWAKYNLGELYDTFKARNHSGRVALQWFKAAAEDGLVQAQYKTACIYLNVELYFEATPWLEKAAAQGHGDAEKILMDKCAAGLVIIRDKPLATKLLEKLNIKDVEILKKLRKNGVQLLNFRGYAVYSAWLKAEPTNTHVLFWYATDSLALGKHDQAIAAYSALIKLADQEYLLLAYQNRATIKRLKEDLAGAAEDYAECIKLDPASITKYYDTDIGSLVLEALIRKKSLDSARKLRERGFFVKNIGIYDDFLRSYSNNREILLWRGEDQPKAERAAKELALKHALEDLRSQWQTTDVQKIFLKYGNLKEDYPRSYEVYYDCACLCLTACAQIAITIQQQALLENAKTNLLMVIRLNPMHSDAATLLERINARLASMVGQAAVRVPNVAAPQPKSAASAAAMQRPHPARVNP